MNLKIYYLKKMKRPWLLKREYADYSCHAHFYKKSHALKVIRLIKARKYPYSDEYKIAMERILTKEEFKRLKKKTRYINVNKGKR